MVNILNFNSKENQNGIIKRNIISILLVFLVLAVFMLFKTLKGGYIVINILFNNALLYLSLALAFVFASAYCIVKLCKIGKRKIVKKMLASIVCLFFSLALLLIISDNVSSSFYLSAADAADKTGILLPKDVFANMDSNENELGEQQVRSWHPFINTEVNEVQQSFGDNTNNYFYSVKIISSNSWLLRFNDEVLKFLCNEYSANFEQINQNIVAGDFIANGQKHKFILQRRNFDLCCIIYRGGDLLVQEVKYPIYD